jgi:hypothetical protein
MPARMNPIRKRIRVLRTPADDRARLASPAYDSQVAHVLTRDRCLSLRQVDSSRVAGSANYGEFSYNVTHRGTVRAKPLCRRNR